MKTKREVVEHLKLVAGVTKPTNPLQETDEIDEYDLAPGQRKLREQIGKELNAEPGMIWRGVHGTIFEFEPSNSRMSAKQLAYLAKVPDIRWFDYSFHNGIAIGL
jgi:hypothetical protein